MLVVIAIIVVLIAMLLPAIQSARESARRAACAVKLKNLAIALHTFHDSSGKLPPSAFYQGGGNLEDLEVQLYDVVPGDATPGPSLAPYSFLVRLLPYIEQAHLLEQIDYRSNQAFAPNNTSPAATVVPMFICPSYRGPVRSRATEYAGRNPAVTNYKALGATTLACLQDPLSATHDLLNGGALHPYASYALNTLKSPTQTAVLVETKEENYAAWFDGTTASIQPRHGQRARRPQPNAADGRAGIKRGGQVTRQSVLYGGSVEVLWNRRPCGGHGVGPQQRASGIGQPCAWGYGNSQRRQRCRPQRLSCGDFAANRR